MKSLVCEMCGGNNLVKQEGVFVCQNCKTKYSLEEAKKMMIEGTVKIDTTDEVTNLYKSARNARDNRNTTQAFKYYEQLNMKDPDNWEPAFFVNYYTAANVMNNDKPGGTCVDRSGNVNLSYEYRSGIALCISKIESCIDRIFPQIEQIKDYSEQSVAVETVCREVVSIASVLEGIIESEYKRMDGEIRQFVSLTSSKDNVVTQIASERMKYSKMDKQNYRNMQSYKQDVSSMLTKADNHKSRIMEFASKRRFDEYWVANQPQKANLETERQSLSNQIDAINNEIPAIPGYTDMVNVSEQVQRLTAQKNALGLFKGKEKKAIQAQIDQTNAHYAQIYNHVNPSVIAIQQRIVSLSDRVNEINNELTRAR